MARISGVNIPLNKRVEIGLTYIYGIGRSTSNRLLAEIGIEPDRKVRDLTEDEVDQAPRADRQRADRRGRPAPRALAERQAPAGDRLLPRAAPPPRSARTRPEHQDQRAHAQGPEAHAGRRQEEGGQEVMPAPRRPQRGRRRVRKNIPVGQAHIKTSFNNTIVSLTDREGNVIAWESAGGAGLQGLAQVNAVRRAGDRRRRPPARASSTASRRSRCSSRAPVRAARPRSARCRPPGSRSPASRTSPRRHTTAAARASGGGSRKPGANGKRHITAVQAVPP